MTRLVHATVPPLPRAHALLVDQQGKTNSVAIEIEPLLGNGQEREGLIRALAMTFPDLTPTEIGEALRDVIALQNLAAVKLAECQRELTRLKVELRRHKKPHLSTSTVCENS